MKDRPVNIALRWIVPALLFIIPLVTTVSRIGFQETLAGHFPCDLYQLQADGFREGRLSLPLDGDEVAIGDTSPHGDQIHLPWGPAPAAIYAVTDILYDAVGGDGPAPKVPLFLLFVVIHLSALFSVLKMWLKKGTMLPLALSIAYYFTFPFHQFIFLYEIGASEVSILYSSTFFLLGLRYLIRSGHLGHAGLIPAGVFIGLAIISRPIYLVYAAIMAAFLVFFQRRLDRHAVGFACSVVAGLILFLVFNQLRFGSVLDFGTRLEYLGIWEIYLWDFEVLPFSLDVAAVHFNEAVRTWFGLHIMPEYNRALYMAEDEIYLSVTGCVFLAGLVVATARSFASPGRRWIEAGLASGWVVLMIFYLVYWQAGALRYSIDIWPVLFLLGVKGLHETAIRMDVKMGSSLGSMVFMGLLVTQLLGSFVFVTWFKGHAVESLEATPAVTSLALTEEHLSNLPSLGGDPGSICSSYPIEWISPSSEVLCKDLPIVPKDDFLTPWLPQRSLHHLGVARWEDGDCRMMFFSGFTLSKEPFRDCRVELALDDMALGCNDIEMWVERWKSKFMNGSERKCTARIPNDERTQVRIYFHFADTDVDLTGHDMRGDSQLRLFRSVRVTCRNENGIVGP